MDEIPEDGTRYTTVKYRLYPNATQTKALERSLEACRWMYNHLLAECKADAIEGIPQKSIFTMEEMVPGLVAAKPSLGDAYSTCHRDVVRRVRKAMSMCTWKEDGNPEHLPRFKSVTRYKSFTYRTEQGFKFVGDRLSLSKIGKIRYRNHHRPKGGEQKCCTISRDARGHWYASVTFTIPDIKSNEMDLQDLNPGIGIDLGLRNIVALSNGEVIPCPDFDAESDEEVKRLKRRMSESSPESEQYKKARRRVAIIKQDNKRKRQGFLNRLAHDIVKGKDIIALEDLDVKAMKEKPDNSAAVRDMYTQASWGELRRMIECKAEGTGAKVVYVNPRNTSRTCSRCGKVKDALPLSQRTYRCECGLTLDRDVNAAINILGLGVETLRKENGRSN